VTNDWSEQDFLKTDKQLQHYGYAIEIHRFDLEQLKDLLMRQRDFLLRLLENPSLLEHESFTQLLLAVFHLIEELACRSELKGLPESDVAHVKGVLEGPIPLGQGMVALHEAFEETIPLSFFSGLKNNPFDQGASPIVR